LLGEDSDHSAAAAPQFAWNEQRLHWPKSRLRQLPRG
jgi:hypothetical protein